MPTKQEVVASLAAVNSVDAGVASEFVDEQVDENDHHLLETRAPLAAVGYWMAAKSRHSE